MASQAPLDAAVDAFLTTAAVERGLSPSTLEAYGRDLARFAGFLAGSGVARLADARREHLAGFARALEREGLSARSRARALVASRRLLRHAGVAGDALAGLASPRLPHKLPRVLRTDESVALIEAAGSDVPLGVRDRAMLEVLYGAGLRVSELVGLPLVRDRSPGGPAARARQGPPGADRADRRAGAREPRCLARAGAAAAAAARASRRRRRVPVAPRRGDDPPELLRAAARDRAARGHPVGAGVAARAAPRVRDRPPGGRGRPARGAGDARPRGSRRPPRSTPT